MTWTFPPGIGSLSPWGGIQSVAPLGPEAVAVTTASHGGICVSADALARIPRPCRATGYSAGGWFEEDCDWAIPYLALGLHIFEGSRADAVRLAARRTIWRWHRAHAGLLGVHADPAAQEEGEGGGG